MSDPAKTIRIGTMISATAGKAAENIGKIADLGFESFEPFFWQTTSGQDLSELGKRCLDAIGHPRVFAFSTRGRRLYTDVSFASDDALLFGCETAGLPDEVIDALPEAQRIRLPMQPGNRSLNLSNAVAVAVFEVWRQAGFEGAAP